MGSDGRGEQLSETLSPLISAPRIKKRVAALARQISADHDGALLTLVVVLKGAAVFAADLMRQIGAPFVVDFVRASSYGNSARSSGTVLLNGEAGLDIAGRRVILIEDIVDTGLTISTIVEALSRRRPASLDICTLLHKRVSGAQPLTIRYKGFDVPDIFVVGYGIDYAERYRNLPGLYQLIPDAGPNRPASDEGVR
jgi:hypoxanthine phosphoribosyltransferase